jgi:hypothetical protein
MAPRYPAAANETDLPTVASFARRARAGRAPPAQSPVAGAPAAPRSGAALSSASRRFYTAPQACGPSPGPLSTWLNGGVYPTQVAEWAGHGVDVLLRIYAKCVVGQDELAKRRISEALRQS